MGPYSYHRPWSSYGKRKSYYSEAEKGSKTDNEELPKGWNGGAYWLLVPALILVALIVFLLSVAHL